MAAPRLGVTGGIGSGKSTVIALLARHGAAVIDTDAIARALTAPGGAALDAVRAQFGVAVFAADGSLDRGRLRQAVFADPLARRRLEAILHPRILEACQAQARALAGAPLLAFDVPLLVEADAFRAALQLDRILVIDCPPVQQRARTLARGGLSAAEVDAVIAAQAPRGARLDLADDVLVNAGSLQDLAAQVAELGAAYGLPAPAAGDGAV